MEKAIHVYLGEVTVLAKGRSSSYVQLPNGEERKVTTECLRPVEAARQEPRPTEGTARQEPRLTADRPTAFTVKKEANGFNVYDSADLSEWLLGNISATDARQLLNALQNALIEESIR